MSKWLFSSEHEFFRANVRKFVQKEVVPLIDECEERGEVPRELFQRVGELGYFGLKFPEQYGGAGDSLAAAIYLEEMGCCGSGGLAAALGAHSEIAIPVIAKCGTEEQKQKYLVPAIQGKKIAALAVTEPFAGSDVSGIRTTAVRQGDHYLLNGSKTFITNGCTCDFAVVAAKTDPAKGAKGLSIFIVEREFPGFSSPRKIEKLGWHASDTGELAFVDCKVPAENRIGNENQGFQLMMKNFTWERLIMGLGSTAVAAKTLEEGIEYASQRVQFGQPLTGFQVTRHKLAELASRIEASREMTYHSLDCYLNGEDPGVKAAMAKAYATELVNEVVDAVLQLHGGYGYAMEYPIQRYWRDVRLQTIGGGTSQIMKEIIAKELIAQV